MDKRRSLFFLGGLILSIGALLGAALSLAAVWADLEAVFYGFDKISDDQLSTLRCPVLISSQDEGIVSATFSNPSETAIEPLIRADISGPGVFRSERTKLHLEPGETKQVSWTVTSADVDLGNFIFLKAASYPASIFPAREATCGIFVVDLAGLPGNQIFLLTVGGSLVCMLVGVILLQVSNPAENSPVMDMIRRLKFIAALVSVTLLASLAGWWLIGAVLLAVIVLAVGAILAAYLQDR